MFFELNVDFDGFFPFGGLFFNVFVLFFDVLYFFGEFVISRSIRKLLGVLGSNDFVGSFDFIPE